MGLVAALVLRAEFGPSDSRRVERYLPEAGRVALIDDVPARDAQAYAIIEELAYALVARIDRSTLICRFEVSEFDAYDAEVARVFAAFHQLGARSLFALVEVDGDERTLYVAPGGARPSVLVLDAANRATLAALGDRAALALAKKVASGRLRRWRGSRWDAPANSPQPLLAALDLGEGEP